MKWEVKYFDPNREDGFFIINSDEMNWEELPKEGVLSATFMRRDLVPPHGVFERLYQQVLQGYDYYWYDGAFTFGGWNDELEAWGGLGRQLKWLPYGDFSIYVFSAKPNKPEKQILHGIMVPPPWDKRLGFVR